MLLKQSNKSFSILINFAINIDLLFKRLNKTNFKIPTLTELLKVSANFYGLERCKTDVYAVLYNNTLMTWVDMLIANKIQLNSITMRNITTDEVKCIEYLIKNDHNINMVCSKKNIYLLNVINITIYNIKIFNIFLTIILISVCKCVFVKLFQINFNKPCNHQHPCDLI